MSTYNKAKFYWLQLREDFFDDDAISWLEEQQPKGKEYALFYLKLCLKSLKTNGILIRNVGNFLVPYDNKKLAELTKTDFDTVTIAMELFKKIGLIQILENGEIYLKQLENLIGSKSIGAFKKEQQRALKNNGGQLSTECPPNIDIELEQELELDLDNNNPQEPVLLPDDLKKEEIISKTDYEQEFDKIWELYPNKKGKTKSLNKYILARKKGTTYEQVLNGVTNYIEYIKKNKISQQYVKHGDTYFNNQCWLDEYKDETNDKSQNDEQWALLKGVYNGTIKIDK